VSKEKTFFRAIIGLTAMLGSLAGFFALFFIEIPVGNRDAMMLALGLVFGWASAVVSSEYGSTSTGRKIADSAIRNSERLTEAATAASVNNDTLNLDESMKG
jgi:predicted RND superfamily exporter protein